MPYATDALYGDTAQIQHSSHDLFGSGRLIGRNLVLTARHVVTLEASAELPVHEGWQVRLVASSPNESQADSWSWIEARVAWTGSDTLDLALLELCPKLSALDCYPKLKLRIGQIDEVRHHRVRGLGFPRGAKVNNKRTLFVPSGDLDDEKARTLTFGIDQAYQPESPAEDWRGFSGASVLLEESPDPQFVWIYGVAQQVPQNFNRRLEVARLAKAWEDRIFRAVLKAADVFLDSTADPIVFHGNRSDAVRSPLAGRIRTIELTELEGIIHAQSNKLALVIFYASWSAPSRQLLSIFSELATFYAERVQIYKIEIPDELPTQHQLGLTLLPTVFVYLNGTIREKIIGKRSITELRELIDQHLSSEH